MTTDVIRLPSPLVGEGARRVGAGWVRGCAAEARLRLRSARPRNCLEPHCSRSGARDSRRLRGARCVLSRPPWRAGRRRVRLPAVPRDRQSRRCRDQCAAACGTCSRRGGGFERPPRASLLQSSHPSAVPSRVGSPSVVVYPRARMDNNTPHPPIALRRWVPPSPTRGEGHHLGRSCLLAVSQGAVRKQGR